MRRLLNIVLTLLTAGLSGCSSLPFYPSPDVEITPQAAGLVYEDVRLATADGETIAGWFIPAAGSGGGAGKGRVLLFFHGNAGNISHRLESLLIFHSLGLDQLIIDYRGFGQSTGKPSVEGTVLDAEAAWNWLVQDRGYAPEQIVLFGRSLGGGVAASLAARTSPGGLILESTFTSLYDVAKDMYPLLPVGLFLPKDYDTPGNLERVRAPLLVVHSRDDQIVPYRLGRAVYDGYSGPKQFLEIQGSHNTGFSQSKAAYARGLEGFLEGLPKRSR